MGVGRVVMGVGVVVMVGWVVMVGCVMGCWV